MPKIPEYEPTQVPGPVGGLTSFKEQNFSPVQSIEQAQQFGQQGAKIGNALTEFGMKLEQAQQANAYHNAVAQVYDQAYSKKFDYTHDPNINTVEQRASADFAAMREQLGQGLAPHYQALFNQNFGKIVSPRVLSIRNTVATRQTEELKANLLGQVDKYERVYRDPSTTDIERLTAQDNLIKTVNTAANRGIVSKVFAQQTLEKFGQSIPQLDFLRDLNNPNNNPVEVLANKNQYGLGVDKLQWAEAQAHHIIARNQQQHFSDYMRQIQQVYVNPNAQMPSAEQVIADSQPGTQRLTTAQAGSILAYVEGAKANPEGKTDPIARNEIVTKIANNEITLQDLQSNFRSGKWLLNPKDYEHFSDKIIRQDKGEEKLLETYENRQLKNMQTLLGGKQTPEYQGFLNQWTQEKQQGWTREQIEENLTKVADVWMQKRMDRGNMLKIKPPKTILERISDYFAPPNSQETKPRLSDKAGMPAIPWYKKY